MCKEGFSSRVVSIGRTPLCSTMDEDNGGGVVRETFRGDPHIVIRSCSVNMIDTWNYKALCRYNSRCL